MRRRPWWRGGHGHPCQGINEGCSGGVRSRLGPLVAPVHTLVSPPGFVAFSRRLTEVVAPMRAKLDTDPRAETAGGLGDGVLPSPLAAPAHHDQVAVTDLET